MPEQIYIGNVSKGVVTSREAFVIDNDAFPVLYNAYSWRGRVKRKRGTQLLGRLEIQVQSVFPSPAHYQVGPIMTLDGAGHGSANLISEFGLAGNATIVPGSIAWTDGANTYIEPIVPDGTIVGTPAGSGTINYATGDVTISGGAAGADIVGQASVASFSYYPGLPVMGLRDFVVDGSTIQPYPNSNYPLLLAFDTEFSYEITQAGVPSFYNVSFYKDSENPLVWNGQDYQLFWTTNYEKALWATNNVPGFHIVNGTYSAGTGTSHITFNFQSLAANYTQLIVGDQLWFNEWSAGGSTINGLVGVVSDATGAAAGNYIVNFGSNQTVAGTGIAQLLTNSITGQDGIRWYDGDPTAGSGIPASTGLGWVNFSPPLSATGQTINNHVSATPFYLVGALAIVAFKDRLLFFSPYIQNSGMSSVPILLQDTVIWSWNGTPYYASLTPTGQTSDKKAYYVDQTGLGGYLPAGISKPIMSVGNNEDVLLVGFGGSGRKTRFVYTGDDLQPFLFFNINSEMPSTSPFSTVVVDKGMMDVGSYGITITDQQACQRIDLDIPDSVFTIQLINSGTLRVNAIRDFFKEWIYFSYPLDTSPWRFPTQSFLFNYRDNTWGILYENFTAHGTFRLNPRQQYTWATIPATTWEDWLDPWGSGNDYSEFPSIIAGNPQGYVLVKDKGMGEAQSGTIFAISNDGMGNSQISSIDHCVESPDLATGIGDYLYFQDALGLASYNITGITLGFPTVIAVVGTSFSPGMVITFSGIAGTTELNGNNYIVGSVSPFAVTINIDSTGFTPWSAGGSISSVFNGLIGLVIATPDADTFVVDIPAPAFGTSGYLGNGTYSRLSQPLIQTKQFAPYWDQGRQCRLSAQKYLLDGTPEGQVTVNIYLSQDANDVWNSPVNNPGQTTPLIYKQLMYTCPESGNIGLTPANTNLQMPFATAPYPIWHRFNTSLIGDSVQIGITLSNDTPGITNFLELDAQMRNLTFATSEITLHGLHLTVDKAGHLA